MKKHSIYKKVIAGICILTLIGVKVFSGKSDSDIRDEVVMLKGKGFCSGIQIQAPSGASYILSAGHCKPLSEDGQTITVVTEDHKKLSRRIIEEDANSDLLLIEGLPGKKGLSIADHASRFTGIRTFTHGGGHSTYTTSGLIVDDKLVQIPIFKIENEQQRSECIAKSKYMLFDDFLFGPICILNVIETSITAAIVPGSSGGAIVDSSGDLVGIASSMGGGFYYSVSLFDIKKFLRAY